jgi:hypothetical protein
MAGEWIPYDVCLPQKPEVLDLVDRTGLEADQVVGRMMMLWGWAALNSRDGSARLSLRLLSKVCGGDEAFWFAVQDVGWLTIDAEGGTVGIPGWDARFSKAAKSRALATVRHQVDKVGAPRARGGGAPPPPGGRAAPPTGAPRARERGDRISSSSPRVAALGEEDQDGPPAGWDTLRAAWAEAVRKGHGKPWSLPTAPDKLADRLDEPGWFEKFLAAVEALPRCKYFRDPVTLPQLVAPGFVDKILGGQFDNEREPRGGGGPRRPDDRPPPQAFTGSDAEAFEATKRRLAEQLRAQEGAA